jgi:periplasmic divalent cation tolerance protein
MKFKVVVGYATFPDEITARKISEKLVEENVIACANIFGPMHSIYKWQGKTEREQEWFALFKTAAKNRSMLKERFRAIHPYQTPCLVFLEIADGLPGFLQWVSTQTL